MGKAIEKTMLRVLRSCRFSHGLGRERKPGIKCQTFITNIKKPRGRCRPCDRDARSRGSLKRRRSLRCRQKRHSGCRAAASIRTGRKQHMLQRRRGRQSRPDRCAKSNPNQRRPARGRPRAARRSRPRAAGWTRVADCRWCSAPGSRETFGSSLPWCFSHLSNSSPPQR